MYLLTLLVRGDAVRFGDASPAGNAFVVVTPSETSHFVAESRTSDASRLDTLSPLLFVPASHMAADDSTVVGALSATFFVGDSPVAILDALDIIALLIIRSSPSLSSFEPLTVKGGCL